MLGGGTVLNPTLDFEQLAAAFVSQDRIQIPDVLVADAAESLYDCLVNDVPWGLAYTDGERPHFLHADEIATFDQAAWAEIVGKAHRPTGKYQFMFAYNSYMMLEAYKEHRDSGLVLHRVFEFLNSEEFIGLLRRVTRHDEVRLAMAQATRYMPGHFLTKHNDIADKEYRHVAYVLNMTKKWRADWGGLLQFTDEHDNIVETFMPAFNSLTLFSVPMWHRLQPWGVTRLPAGACPGRRIHREGPLTQRRLLASWSQTPCECRDEDGIAGVIVKDGL